MSSGDSPPNGSNASTILLDHIRTLRDPLPSATFLDNSSGERSPSYDGRNASANGSSGTINPNSSPQQTQDSYFQASSSGHATESRTQPTTLRAPRRAVYPALSSEELGKTPKERFQAYLAPSSPPSSTKPYASTRPAEPIRTTSDSVVAANTSPPHKAASHQSSPTKELRSAPAVASGSTAAQAKFPESSTRAAGNSAMSARASPALGSASDRPTPASAVASSPASPKTSQSLEADAAALIANAGSADAAVQALLKEKQALTSRNDQLWKLVEKQRTMILGLNKDLERIVKDREKYRKKFKDKEKETAGVPMPNNPDGTVQQSPWANSDAPQQDMAQKYGHRKDPSIDTLLSIPHPDAPDPSSGTSNSTTTSFGNPSSYANSSRSKHHPLPLRDIDTNYATPRSGEGSLATASSVQAKSPSYATVGESKRKAPPQPLNLQQRNQTSIDYSHEDALDSGSDYDEQSPPVERGRRKTREEDDRLREESYTDEQTNSENIPDQTVDMDGPQQNLNHSQAYRPSNDGHTGVINGTTLPTSPRAPLLGALQSPLPAAQGSISSKLMQGNRSVPAANSQQSQTRNLEPQVRNYGLPLKSPGLPMSPRPGDRPVNAPTPRLPNQQINAPGPMSPRSAMVLSPRAPRQPIMLQQDGPLGITSPHVVRAERLAQQSNEPPPPADMAQANHFRNISRDDADPANLSKIYRGFSSEQYPGLLLPPNALPLVEIRVESARLRPSRIAYMTGKNGEEESIFTLAVYSRSDNRQLWRLEKQFAALSAFDPALRKTTSFPGRLPERGLFTGHAPARIDARRHALNQYFAALIDVLLDDVAAFAVCDFLSTDAIGPEINDAYGNRRKEGYLAKKGKQFGGWKARYFILDGGELRYFEGPSGGHLGSIKLAKAQIAKQTVEEASDEAEFRHAFMILEPKRRDSTTLIRHVLCAESDEERDAWVNSLMLYVDESEDLSSRPSMASDASRMLRPGHSNSGTPSIHSISYEQTVSAGIPQQGYSTRSTNTPSPEDNSAEFGTPSIQSSTERPNISGPVAGGPIQNVQAWGNKSPTLKDNDPRKRNIFGFRSRTSEDSTTPSQPSFAGSGHHSIDDQGHGNLPHPHGGNSHNGRPVFGIPLIEAAHIFPPRGIDVCLPSPVYRCIEFMEAKNAYNEEGIFRMSGSNTVIKQLRERFNTEGDVKLLDNPSYDVHAVASLLKLYLRELPESVLTRELHLDFLKVLDAEEKSRRLEAINILAHRLPEANFELLAAVTRFLIGIVNNSEVNKMNVRNVGIVFSPTLNIPAPLFSLLLSDHESIFGRPADPASSPVIASIDSNSTSVSPTSANTPIGPEDLRSPRKQMFTDLATPAYNQTSFGSQYHGDSLYQPMTAQPTQLTKAEFEAGFITMQPRASTEMQNSGNQTQYRGIPAPIPRIQVPEPGGGGFSSLNAALAAGSAHQKP